jgi:hypothetical protein
MTATLNNVNDDNVGNDFESDSIDNGNNAQLDVKMCDQASESSFKAFETIKSSAQSQPDCELLLLNGVVACISEDIEGYDCVDFKTFAASNITRCIADTCEIVIDSHPTATAFHDTGFYNMKGTIKVSGSFPKLTRIGAAAFSFMEIRGEYDNAFATESSIVFGKDALPVLVEIGVTAFKGFSGVLHFQQGCFPSLRTILTSAFNHVSGFESRVELVDQAELVRLGKDAFRFFAGTLTLKGDLPALEEIAEDAFATHENAEAALMVRPDSVIELLDLPKLQAIFDRAFNHFRGAVTVQGFFPSLELIGHHAFSGVEKLVFNLTEGGPALRCVGEGAFGPSESSKKLETPNQQLIFVMAGSFPCLKLTAIRNMSISNYGPFDDYHKEDKDIAVAHAYNNPFGWDYDGRRFHENGSFRSLSVPGTFELVEKWLNTSGFIPNSLLVNGCDEPSQDASFREICGELDEKCLAPSGDFRTTRCEDRTFLQVHTVGNPSGSPNSTVLPPSPTNVKSVTASSSGSVEEKSQNMRKGTALAITLSTLAVLVLVGLVIRRQQQSHAEGSSFMGECGEQCDGWTPAVRKEVRRQRQLKQDLCTATWERAHLRFLASYSRRLFSTVTSAEEHRALIEKIELPRQSVRIHRELGIGNYGIVRSAHLRSSLIAGTDSPSTGASEVREVAVKTRLLRATDPTVDEALLIEALVLHALDHPSILKLIGICATKLPFMVVTELMCNGDLKSYLRQCRPTLPKPKAVLTLLDVIVILEKITSALAHLESVQVIHRDVAAWCSVYWTEACAPGCYWIPSHACYWIEASRRQ